MLRRDHIKAAAEDVVAAALLEEGWEEALERFARAAGARDAVLMRNTANRMVSAVTTGEVAEAVAQFAAGNTPPNSRYVRVKSDPRHGFRVDHDDYTDDELARDPFYQEFLRVNGVFWHANLVMMTAHDEHIELSLKRRIHLGPYQRGDVAVLNSVLPELRAAARIASGTLNAELRGMTRLLRRRGKVIVELDRKGQVLPSSSFAEPNPSLPLRVIGQRLMTTDGTFQKSLDRAIAEALNPPERVALAPLAGSDGRRYFLQLHPVPGRARDVFLSAAAVGVLIEHEAGPAWSSIDPHSLRSAFGLTDRESDVASLLAEGRDLPSIARRLRIRAETARGYLKNVFEKTGTRRQAELVALLARLKP